MIKLKRLIWRSILYFILISFVFVLPVRWLNPPVSMVMLERSWQQRGSDYDIKQQWLAWRDIPHHAALAAVVSEDQNFPHHYGIDLKAIQKAIEERQRRGSLRGASTISQQVARNMYLWTGRSWFRKGLEVWFTGLIELCWPKQRILEVYLNIAEWGDGVFGLAAASQHHFATSAAALTPWQSALLASSLPSPLKYQPAAPAPHLIERANWNLKQQQRLGGKAWLASLE
ncbi:Biosynthetic peptidoglycan transglycosylase [Zhongshania aliphaticivorans]|uniref:Biosynthetic peptidoglycan transglycosylase n=1 Tax=Zhongshania aliphaticivorans TaxID=1470434 RepID=A0A5S9PJU2_9GAMM|nr:monofunctional biosynthetic peptidoglycan transglycosylase [Zhongshania aliphaticivorans]CAA0104001.1 Biosynthetic peptidoglycan transglycosylase [Zhongshania aliphaticivorans]CAA0104156.1 Biosynthetic peptidoglycan transglycosylase [Zhongshania aliphaticivorans]